mmetsp:Transcript_23612/g.62226  ORF Transcript_23612/g.62226 Transcript_23612/m.62226 type:complete len:115 (-) Transcript_23612:638-982(-)
MDVPVVEQRHGRWICRKGYLKTYEKWCVGVVGRWLLPRQFPCFSSASFHGVVVLADRCIYTDNQVETGSLGHSQSSDKSIRDDSVTALKFRLSRPSNNNARALKTCSLYPRSGM